jgi:outer membrane protein
MKQFSLFLNILLLLAVAVLFYLQFSTGKKGETKNAVNNSFPQAKDSCSNGHLIAFVQMDSIYDNVTYIRQLQTALDKEQEDIAAQYERGALQFQKERNDYFQQAKGMTDEQREQAELKLGELQRTIETNRQTQMQGLATKKGNKMEEIQSKLRKFLNDYNSDRRYAYIFATGVGLDYMMYKDSASNITTDVIAGLNKEFDKKDK